MLCSVQPFSVAGAGGGPRILASLFDEAPLEVLPVCTAPRPHVVGEPVDEIQLPNRPHFGRLESTRLNRQLGAVSLLTKSRFERRLKGVVERSRVTAMHAVAHGTDFSAAQTVARELELPFLLSVHDDPSYTLAGRPESRFGLRELGVAWRDAQKRFVISTEMGDAMNARFGTRPYVLVTDGLSEIADSPRPLAQADLTGYFMGAFHISYTANLESLVSGLARWRQKSGRGPRMVVRSGPLPAPADLDPEVPVEFRDWAPAGEVAKDLDDVDFLYLPLPFGDRHENFIRYSLSTKLVTYVGSGLPILYHGPRHSAACSLLERSSAAAIVDSLEPDAVMRGIEQITTHGGELAANALDLARERFDLTQIRSRFWEAVEDATNPTDAELVAPIAPGATMP